MANIRILQSIRIQGDHVPAGTVLSTADLPDGLWQTLCGMEPARAEETSDPVGAAPAVKPGKSALPGIQGD